MEMRKDVVVETTETFVLTLNRDEAQFLFDVMDRIGGNGHDTRRCHAEDLSGLLSEAEVLPIYPTSDMEGNIQFSDATGEGSAR